MVLIVGITGATGAIYSIRLLEVLSYIEEVETHLVISSAGKRIISLETMYKIEEVQKLATFSYEVDDIGARIASGSFIRDAMAVVPCSMKTMSALAYSYADNLITRAGDVTLKERKALVIAPRETPLHLGHIENMLRLAQMGATIFPLVPSFYNKPKSLQDVIDQTVGRILDILGIKQNLTHRWNGVEST